MIPAQENFIIPFGIKSVIGLGSLLPSGEIFIVILFTKAELSQDMLDLFNPIALV